MLTKGSTVQFIFDDIDEPIHFIHFSSCSVRALARNLNPKFMLRTFHFSELLSMQITPLNIAKMP